MLEKGMHGKNQCLEKNLLFFFEKTPGMWGGPYFIHIQKFQIDCKSCQKTIPSRTNLYSHGKIHRRPAHWTFRIIGFHDYIWKMSLCTSDLGLTWVKFYKMHCKTTDLHMSDKHKGAHRVRSTYLLEIPYKVLICWSRLYDECHFFVQWCH